MNRNFQLYITYACNIDELNRCIESAVPQLNEFSTWEGKKIVVINDSQEDISNLVSHKTDIEIFEFPYRIKMAHAQQINWLIQDSKAKGQPFGMTIHSDAELLPGAMKDLLEKVEEVYDSKWGIVFGGKMWQVFAVYNHRFFFEENIWFDPFLFPFYYMDNHMHRIMELWGWPVLLSNSPDITIKHKSSHYLKEDPVFCRKNNIAFPAHGQIYTNIWGGLPGAERSNDKYANGTLPRK